MATLLQDLRYGLRQLRRNPGFTLVTVVTLALGIGANTSIFTVVNTVLLHPLPYPDSDRIVSIVRGEGGDASVPMFTYWEQTNLSFNDLAAYRGGTSVTLNDAGSPELVEPIKASRNYFRLFGANPILGRTFSAAEDRPGGPRVVVMSYGLWQRRFGSEPSILGKTITFGGAPYAVIGVLSPGFKPYPPADVWMPLQPDTNSTDQAHVLTVSGRLPRGTTLAQANSQMAVIGRQYIERYPEQLGTTTRSGSLPCNNR